jgi:hypothetical protein
MLDPKLHVVDHLDLAEALDHMIQLERRHGGLSQRERLIAAWRGAGSMGTRSPVI